MVMDIMRPIESPARHGNLEKTIRLIHSDTDLSLALGYATEHGHLHIIEHFVNQGNVTHCKDILEKAATYGHMHIVKYIVGLNIDISAFCDSTAALSNAASSGHLSIVEYLINLGANINNTGGTRGLTPLLNAIYNYNTEAAIYLIKAGSDLGINSRAGTSPLIAAVSHHIAPIVKCLIDAGCQITDIDKDGRTLLHLAMYYQPDTKRRHQYVREVYGDDQVFIEGQDRIICDEIMDVVKLLLMLGINKDIVDVNGHTAGYYAAKRGFNEVASYIESYCDIMDMSKGVQPDDL